MASGLHPADILVIGADGLLGRHVMSELSRRRLRGVATSRRGRPGALAFDLADPNFAALAGRYSVAIVCAAMTDLRACEESPERAKCVNVTNTLATMRRLAETGAHLVFVSSSQVFDGEQPLPDESAPCRPKNVYGRYKLEVEEAIATERLPAAVLRLTKVLAQVPVGMFRTWYEGMLRGEPVVAAHDMTVAPVAAAGAADTVVRLALGRAEGTWHFSSADEIPYAQAAQLMAETCRLPLNLVRGEATSIERVPMKYRHKYAAIAASRYSRAQGIVMRPARELLMELFAAFPGLVDGNSVGSR